jgi:nicotinamide mononucleotide transporter
MVKAVFMGYQELYQGLVAGLRNMSWPEGLAVAFSIASVLYARVNSIWVYPTGIAGILLSIYIFIGAAYKLYPDVALNLYYLVMSVYGWYFWARKPRAGDGEPAEHTPVTWCTRRDLVTGAVLFGVLWAGLYFWLSTYRINNVPVMDSFSSAMAAVGMWLLARRKIENWIALLIADGVDIGMFFVKKLILFSFLNVFYVVIAVLGFIAWKKIYRAQGLQRHSL